MNNISNNFTIKQFNIDNITKDSVIFAQSSDSNFPEYIVTNFLDVRKEKLYYSYSGEIDGKLYRFLSNGISEDGNYVLKLADSAKEFPISIYNATEKALNNPSQEVVVNDTIQVTLNRNNNSNETYTFKKLNVLENVALSTLHSLIALTEAKDPEAISTQKIRLLVDESFNFAYEFIRQATKIRTKDTYDDPRDSINVNVSVSSTSEPSSGGQPSNSGDENDPYVYPTKIYSVGLNLLYDNVVSPRSYSGWNVPDGSEIDTPINEDESYDPLTHRFSLPGNQQLDVIVHLDITALNNSANNPGHDFDLRIQNNQDPISPGNRRTLVLYESTRNWNYPIGYIELPSTTVAEYTVGNPENRQWELVLDIGESSGEYNPESYSSITISNTFEQAFRYNAGNSSSNESGQEMTVLHTLGLLWGEVEAGANNPVIYQNLGQYIPVGGLNSTEFPNNGIDLVFNPENLNFNSVSAQIEGNTYSTSSLLPTVTVHLNKIALDINKNDGPCTLVINNNNNPINSNSTTRAIYIVQGNIQEQIGTLSCTPISDEQGIIESDEDPILKMTLEVKIGENETLTTPVSLECEFKQEYEPYEEPEEPGEDPEEE